MAKSRRRTTPPKGVVAAGLAAQAPLSERAERKLRVKYVAIGRLVAHARNARTHSKRQVEQLVASIREFGWTNPVLIDDAGIIIAGHGRVLAAQELTMARVPCIEVAGLTAAQKSAYRIADNKLAERGGWDAKLLALELNELDLVNFDLDLIGLRPAELQSYLAPTSDEGADAAGNALPDPVGDVVSQSGDLWVLGRHRLLCGDSADAASVRRLMKDDRASLIFTSPPYGSKREYTTGSAGDWDELMRGVFTQLDLIATAECQVLVNLGIVHYANEWQPYWEGWIEWMRNEGWRRFGWYVWEQGAGLPGDWNGRLAPAFEWVFHFNKQTVRPNKIVPCKSAGTPRASGHGLRNTDGSLQKWVHAGKDVQDTKIADSVIRIERHRVAGIDHPAVFPIDLPAFIMESFSEINAIVCDPFAGSGTTIMAGEGVGRRVRAIEVSPKYCDTAIRRWDALYPGQLAMLDDAPKKRGSVADFTAVKAARAKEAA